jgi:HAMP domain-containing protein
VAYVVTLKLAANWFPASYFSMISGLGLLAAVTWVLARDDPRERGYRSYALGESRTRRPARFNALAGIREVWGFSSSPRGFR